MGSPDYFESPSKRVNSAEYPLLIKLCLLTSSFAMFSRKKFLALHIYVLLKNRYTKGWNSNVLLDQAETQKVDESPSAK